MALNPRIWFPIAVGATALNLVAAAFYTGTHAGMHAALAVGFGLWAQRLRQRMMEEITVEDRLNEEVRNILTEHQEEMRRTSVSYQEMYKKAKQQLARDRKLILR